MDTEKESIQQANLYADVEWPQDCRNISRICFTTKINELDEEGAVGKIYNDSYNSNNNSDGTLGIPFFPEWSRYGNYVEWRDDLNEGLTLSMPNCNVYKSEYFDEFKLEDLNKSVPPICPSCVPLTYPKICLEGGGIVPKGDATAEGLEKDGGDVEFNIYPISLLYSNNYTYWWPHIKEHLPIDEETGLVLDEYEYETKWVWAEEIDKYETVSTWVKT
jgi:hypothetical protein